MNLTKLRKVVATGEARAVAYLAAATAIITAVEGVLPGSASTALGAVGLWLAGWERKLASAPKV